MTNTALNIFGVRHLSPASAYHLNAYLNQIKPKYVLIEGPSDALDLLKNLAHKKLKPPVALLAYTTSLPIETVLYPFAEYSPEFQAVIWAVKNNAELVFIDLPCEVILKVKQKQYQEKNEQENAYYQFHSNIYNQLATLYGETDYEDYWERNFEHNLQEIGFQQAINYQTKEIRTMVEQYEQEAVPSSFAYNLVREAHMRRQIKRLLSEGIDPKKMLIVVGAYHVAGLDMSLPEMTDDEYAALPRTSVKMTLMPYSYHRLSSRTGYGAGNAAPYYFELMWQCIKEHRVNDLPAIYFSKIAQLLRASGNNASSASVIEAVRLAKTLSMMRNGHLPVLSDLHDATKTCFGAGELLPVAEAINRVDIGTSIGQIPEEISQSPVQEDVNRQLKLLKLTEYKAAEARELTLDLRENIRVKSTQAAFIDLNRSTFLHRLTLLGITFAKQISLNQQSATWAENWMLQWSPDVEIEIVEANLKGESIEISSAYELKDRLDHCTDVSAAAQLIKLACECGLMDNFSNAIGLLQKLLIEAYDFNELAEAARELSLLLQYGSLRQFDVKTLDPILQQLFLRASLVVYSACNCDDKAASKIASSINIIDLISQEHYNLVDLNSWQTEITKVAFHDNRNAQLSGTAFSILLAHNLINDHECANEVSRRLSPSIPADLVAGWFEGLSSRNHYVLLSRIALWRQLDNYLQTLSEEDFFRSVVFLRRAFGTFEPKHKNSIAELLADIWGTGTITTELLQEELSEDESKKLSDLNDFDFGDFL